MSQNVLCGWVFAVFVMEFLSEAGGVEVGSDESAGLNDASAPVEPALGDILGPDITAAAQGDRASQCDLRDNALRNAGELVPEREGLICAEVMARLAASHGHGEDVLSLCAVLLLRAAHADNQGNESRCRAFWHEAVKLMEALVSAGELNGLTILAATLASLADDGDELAAVKLNLLMESLSPPDAERLVAGQAKK